MSKFKRITVLDFDSGQVYLRDFDEEESAVNKFDYVDRMNMLTNIFHVEYMVHKFAPSLWTKGIYYCNYEQAYALKPKRDECT